nr:GumC family protein [uncultured Cohaesibacter sp.]
MVHPDMESNSANFADDVRKLLFLIKRSARVITVCVALSVLLGVAYLWYATPKYVSSAEILIDPRPRQQTQDGAAPTGLGTSSAGADIALVQSQIGVIGSRSALNALINEFDLLDDEEFGNANGQPSRLTSLIKSVIYGPSYASRGTRSPHDRALEKLGKAVKVERAGNTYIIVISVESNSAQKSADLANGLVKIYQGNLQSRASRSNAETASAIEARLDGLQKDYVEARRAVEVFRSKNKLVGAQSLPINEQQLRDLTSQLTQASFETRNAKEALEQTNRLATEKVGVGISNNALSSTVVDGLRNSYQNALNQKVSLSVSLGPKHPQMLALDERIANIESSLRSEYRRMSLKAKSEYEAARNKEASLQSLLNSFEQKQTVANAATVQLEELEKIAAAKSRLYQNLLERALKIREQVVLPASTVQILAPAEAPSTPAKPRFVITILLAAILGAVVGVMLFLLGEIKRIMGPTPKGRDRQSRRKEEMVSANTVSIAAVASTPKTQSQSTGNLAYSSPAPRNQARRPMPPFPRQSSNRA